MTKEEAKEVVRKFFEELPKEEAFQLPEDFTKARSLLEPEEVQAIYNSIVRV